MKMKQIVPIILCVAIASCLAVGTASFAYAADDGTATLKTATLETTAVTVNAAAKTTTPKPKVVRSVKGTFKNGDTNIMWQEGSKNPSTYITVSWKAPKTVKGLKSQTYTVRYTGWEVDLPYAKTKKTSKTFVRIPKNQAGYVQIRANALCGKRVVHSKWVTVRFSTMGGSRKTYENGIETSYERSSLHQEDLDHGKPGSYEAARLRLIPRSLQLDAGAQAASGTVEVSWKEPKTSNSKIKYAIRYAYNKKMKNAKSEYGISDREYTLTNLKKNKRVYVQVCAFAKAYDSFSGKDTYSRTSRWSDAKSIKVP